MPDAVRGLVDYQPPPDPETGRRRARMLWLAAAISLVMLAAGYILLVYFLLG